MKLLYNSNIITVNPSHPAANAVMIDDHGLIAALDDDAKAMADASTTWIDLEGRTVVPGFNDCHMHLLPFGLDLLHADISPQAGVSDIPQLISKLQQWANENTDLLWVRGSRYDQNIFPGAAHPTRWQLDKAFPERPVYIVQTSKHAAVANSAALRMANISRNTPNPSGGEIVRDERGEPTGVLLETAMELVSACLPKPDRTQMAAAINRANSRLIANGITSASDLNVGWLDMADEIAAYRDAAASGAQIRTTLFPHAPAFGSPNDIPDRESFLRNFGFDGAVSVHSVRPGPIKLFSDGALTTRTAALRQPYIDGSGSGILLHPPDELKAYILKAHQKGWQIAIHAIGDRAVELVLDGYSEAQSAHPRTGVRHRIEHAMLLDDALISRIAEQEVIPVVQPEFLARLGDAYVMGLGMERAERINPNASLNARGVPTPFSSDCPIVPGAPLDGIRAAVNRKTRSGQILGVNECISIQKAIENYTWWAAYSSFDEGSVGRIKPGMRADLTLLSHDPTVDLDECQVAGMIIGGELM